MKILLVQDYLRSGGTERQTVLLSSAFAQAGHAATLITFRPGGALLPTVPASVPHQVLQPFDLQLDWFAPGLSAAAQQRSPDVVLCMGRMANCYAGGLQRRLPSAAVISTMRTGKSLPWLFRRSLRQTRHIVANSRDAANALSRQHAVPPERISVIHNSLVFPSGTATSPTARAATRTTQGAHPGTLVLLSVAMFRPEKNQRALVEIVAGLPRELDWQLWLAGDGEARPACEALVAQLGLGERVKFLGWHRDPSALYDAADVAVHASYSESLSNFLIEAQSRGLPGIAFGAQGIDECFTPGQTGFVIKPNDQNAFRAAFLTFADTSPAKRAVMSERARTFARTTFDPQRQVAAYLDLFQQLVSAPRTP